MFGLCGGGVQGNSEPCHSSSTWWQVRGLCGSFWPMQWQTRNLFEILWPTWGEARSLSKFFFPMWGQTGILSEYFGLHEFQSGVCMLFWHHTNQSGWGSVQICQVWHVTFELLTHYDQHWIENILVILLLRHYTNFGCNPSIVFLWWTLPCVPQKLSSYGGFCIFVTMYMVFVLTFSISTDFLSLS
jgi:hypothetical protein